MIVKLYRFACDDCPTIAEYSNKDAAKAVGWAKGTGNNKCYCPACAPNHRNTGRCGFNNAGSNGKQMLIDEVQECG